MNARLILLIQWLVWATILVHAYRGILLSNLATITWTIPIDTLQQMDQSLMPFVIPDVTDSFFRNDPRDVVNSIRSKGDTIKFKDVFAEATTKKYL